MIKLNKVDKYYKRGQSNEIHVINNTSLTLPDTGLVVFLGQSGSGKTTLLNVIGGLDKASGEITYDDLKLSGYKSNSIDNYRKTNVGYVFQNYNLLPNLTVYENLRISLILSGFKDEKAIDKRIDYVLNALNMKKFKKRFAANLSGGQQQRVSIARALVKDSKLIIADEPTGNLDSQNSIEVMNILKKISTKKLVILVTHNEKLAEFYADRIINIVDGVIAKDSDNNSNQERTLENRKSNDIYLKDLEETNVTNENLNINYYKDNSDISGINIKVVVSEGKVYVSSDDVELKVINKTSSVKLLDKHYEDIKVESIEDFKFDISDIKDNSVKNKINWKDYFLGLKSAITNFTQGSKRNKLVNAGLICIGMVLAVMTIVLGVYNYVNTDAIEYVDDGYVIDSFNYADNAKYYDSISKALEKGYIDDISFSSRMQSLYVTMLVSPSSDSQIYVGETFILPCSKIESNQISYGVNVSNDNEIVISKSVALEYIDKSSNYYTLNMETLIGRSIDVNGSTFKICGIYNSQSTECFVSKAKDSALRTSILAYYNYDYYGQKNWYETISKGITPIYYDSNIAALNIFSLINDSESRFCSNAETAPLECVLPVSRVSSYKIGDDFVCDNESYKVVGYYQSNGYDVALCNSKTNTEKIFLGSNYNYSYDGVTLVTGSLPTSSDEIIVNYSSKYASSIGDKVNGYKIVGTYLSSDSTLLGYITKEAYVSYSLQSSKANLSSLIYITKDKTQLEDFLKADNIKIASMYQANYDSIQETNHAIFASLLAVVFILLGIVIIYIFFMMRSRMFNRIYELGVLRAIGAKKGRVYRLFFKEIFVMTTFTSLAGYLFVIIVFALLLANIPTVLVMFKISFLYTIIGVVALYLLSFIFGLLPAYLLLRKTPAEIITKYDI